METLAHSQRPLSILHLEDNERDRLLIQETLRDAGQACEFRSAASRAEFESALESRKFDLVISDYSMTDYDGNAALRATRRADADVPFLFVSGTIGEERAVESLRNGATDYVLKDNLARLAPAVSRAIREAEELRLRRASDQARHDAESRFREMASAIEDVFRVCSADGGRVTYVNVACERLLGRSAAEILSDPGGWFATIHPDDRARANEAIRNVVRGGCSRIEYRVVRPGGSVRHVEDRIYPVKGPGGNTERMVAVSVDCTERKEKEAQLIESQRMEAVGQLAGGIAHDFNNLITIIKGHLEMLEGRHGLPPSVCDAHRQIAAASDRAASLTRQLLQFSSGQVPHPQTMDLAEAIRKLLPQLRPALGSEIEVIEPTVEEPLEVEADSGMLDQVLTNLAFNARDAMRTGGRLTIGISKAPRDVRDNSGQPGRAAEGYACLSVRDTGTGIAPEVLPRIFEPFFTTKPVGKGSGLGLSSVFGIVKQHKGWIDVRSEIGRGTTFEIYIPLSSKGSSGVHDFKSAHTRGGAGETILLVEDEAPVRALVQAVLELEGYRVIAASDGHTALDLWAARKCEIQMLLTDIVMPGGLTGVDVANRILAERPEIPVLYTSGYAPEYARKRFRVGPEVNFLEKPFEIAQFRRVVRQLLDGVPA